MSIPPQPSPTWPQYWLVLVGLQVFLVQLSLPQTLAVPAAPQPSPAGHAPQSIVPPQLLPMVPQYWPLATEQVVQTPESGVVPQTLGMPPPPQV